MRGTLVFGFGIPWLVGALVGACSSPKEPVGVGISIGPTLLAPRGLLTNVSKLTLTVYDVPGGVDCDAATGRPTGVTTESKEVFRDDLKTGCDPGIAFCGKVSISRSTTERAFYAAGYVGAKLYAVGCAKAVVNQEAIPLEIKMRRFVEEPVCGDGLVQPKEQCEPTGASDPVCDECRTKEVLLSFGSGATGTSTGRFGDKVRPAFVWPAGRGSAGRFLAFFGDKSPPNNHEVTMRVLDDAFGPYTEQGSALQNESFFLPNARGSVLGRAEANDQLNPSAAALGAAYYVAFEDNNSPTGSPDIHLRSLDQGLAALEDTSAPVGINGTKAANGSDGGGESGIQSVPALAAGGTGQLFIAWQDGAAGKIVGRTYTPLAKTYGPQIEISKGANNRHVAVAGSPSGWFVVWESGTDVKLRKIETTGLAAPLDQVVNESRVGSQEQPRVAALDDGRLAVVWTDRGAAGGPDIFIQRFDATGTKIANDQAQRLNDVSSTGDQTTPTIAASSALNGSYVTAWVDEGTGHIQARLVGGSTGYLANSIDGQATEFAASVEGRRTRGNPTIAVGGSNPFIAIGWEDSTGDAKAGIYGRRFPLPSE